MRNYIIPGIILLLLIGGGLFENFSLKHNVQVCTEYLDTVIEKVDDETATAEDAAEFSDIWEHCKSRLHTYIPHTEIREVDQWISEAKSFLATKNFPFARAKLVLLRDKIESIPGSFETNFGNVF